MAKEAEIVYNYVFAGFHRMNYKKLLNFLYEHDLTINTITERIVPLDYEDEEDEDCDEEDYYYYYDDELEDEDEDDWDLDDEDDFDSDDW